MQNEYQAFPLCWPAGYKRTPAHRRIDSRFRQSMDISQRYLRQEVERLTGNQKSLIVSTNLRLRNDGGIYSIDMNKKIEDPGVAIYFKYKIKDISMCCDQYYRVWENIYALGKGIEALRGMERWGVSEFMKRAFTGFTAIPESVTTETWCAILDVLPTATKDQILIAYRKKAKTMHPDCGGTAEQFNKLNDAYQAALNQLA